MKSGNIETRIDDNNTSRFHFILGGRKFMSKRGKVIFGIVTIVLAFISSWIGLWALPSEIKYGFIMRFFLMVTPCITTLAIINLLRDNQ